MLLDDEAKKHFTSIEDLLKTIHNESERFHHYYMWLESSMPSAFFDEVKKEHVILIAHNIMGLQLQDYFSIIRLKELGIVICLDSSDADVRILKHFSLHGIKYYHTFVSKTPPPFPGVSANLRIATVYFTEAIETVEAPYPEEEKEQIRSLAKERIPQLTDDEFNKLMQQMNTRFLRSMPVDRIVMALDMFIRAKTRDSCQFEVRYYEDWQEKEIPSMQIILGWGDTPKHNFLYRMALIIHRHGLDMKKVNATYIEPYSKDTCLLMSLGLHGSNGRAAWEIEDIVDFLREFVTLKYFDSFDKIDHALVSTKTISGNYGNLLRAMLDFIHQTLVHIDPNLYTPEHIEEALCRHPDWTKKLCNAFKFKFDPWHHNFSEYLAIREELLSEVERLDTGNEEYDLRRKNVLRQGLNFIHYCLKTNFYRINFTALSFRLDPTYLDHIPFDRMQKFPVLPFAIFFIKGRHYFGFHVRFKDLARGGLRTVMPDTVEKMISEQNNVFSECYNLALTQQKKNKDIPEGGAKGVIFLKPFDLVDTESIILKKELESAKIDPVEIHERVAAFRKETKLEYLYLAQRSYVDSLLTIINCYPEGLLKAKYIVDYWNKPEYIYLGPDENMFDEMIQWIADTSRKEGYKPDSAFISGKPNGGINHKEFGVTSLGVNVYVDSILRYLGIDPEKDSFTVKLTGGPDGDVAGNEILNLHRYYPNTAKVLAITDVSGTIHDPEGLDLPTLVEMFHNTQPIRNYPPEKLHEGGYLLDRFTKKSQDVISQQTLCWRKKEGQVHQDWLSGNEMNSMFRYNVHKTKADIFIPGGGRPRTLHAGNMQDFLDETGKPTARAIVEGANLYFDDTARRFLEQKGVLIVKDSSANKTGVISSSFEVICDLCLNDEEFREKKLILVGEILEKLKLCAKNEAELLLRTYAETKGFLTDISEKISERINMFTYQILDYLDTQPFPEEPENPLVKVFLDYNIPTMRRDHQKNLMKEIPEHHKKAIVACHIAAQLVYKRGLSWFPSIVEILPLLIEQHLDEKQ